MSSDNETNIVTKTRATRRTKKTEMPEDIKPEEINEVKPKRATKKTEPKEGEEPKPKRVTKKAEPKEDEAEEVKPKRTTKKAEPKEDEAEEVKPKRTTKKAEPKEDEAKPKRGAKKTEPKEEEIKKPEVKPIIPNIPENELKTLLDKKKSEWNELSQKITQLNNEKELLEGQQNNLLKELSELIKMMTSTNEGFNLENTISTKNTIKKPVINLDASSESESESESDSDSDSDKPALKKAPKKRMPICDSESD